MLTPFTEDGQLDLPGLQRLTEWYLANGAQALFAVCQSSEMRHLTVEERVVLAEQVVADTAGWVPVVASGHVADTLEEQIAELQAIAATGIDALVLVTNRIDVHNAGTEAFKQHLDALLAALPPELPLGLYECPAPYRRLLSDEELQYCIDSGRFVLLKDVSCDFPTVERRLKMAEGTCFAVVNANAAIAWPVMQAGGKGFCGVFNNIHPDLYRWLQDHGAEHPELAEQLAVFLVLAANAEGLGYPALAKLYHQRLGTFGSIRCRVIDFDIRERYWALDDIMDRLVQGTEDFRQRCGHAHPERN